jgi:hypothetical protein
MNKFEVKSIVRETKQGVRVVGYEVVRRFYGDLPSQEDARVHAQLLADRLNLHPERTGRPTTAGRIG